MAAFLLPPKEGASPPCPVFLLAASMRNIEEEAAAAEIESLVALDMLDASGIEDPESVPSAIVEETPPATPVTPIPSTIVEETPAVPRKTRGRTPGKNLTDTQKIKICRMWQSGRFTLEELSVKFDRDPNYLSRFFTKMAVKKGDMAEEVERRVAAAVQKRIEEDAVAEAESDARRTIEVKESTYKALEYLRKLSLKYVIDGDKGLKLGGQLNTIKAIQLAIDNIRKAQDGQWQVLGLNGEKQVVVEDLPTLPIQEMTSKDIERVQRESLMDEDEAGVPDLDEPIIPTGDVA